MKAETESELVKNLQADALDPSAWGNAEEEAVLRPRRTEVVSFRLPAGEMDELEVAAAAVGETISGYVRESLTMRMRGQLSTVVNIAAAHHVEIAGELVPRTQASINWMVEADFKVCGRQMTRSERE